MVHAPAKTAESVERVVWKLIGQKFWPALALQPIFRTEAETLAATSFTLGAQILGEGGQFSMRIRGSVLHENFHSPFKPPKSYLILGQFSGSRSDAITGLRL